MEEPLTPSSLLALRVLGLQNGDLRPVTDPVLENARMRALAKFETLREQFRNNKRESTRTSESAGLSEAKALELSKIARYKQFISNQMNAIVKEELKKSELVKTKQEQERLYLSRIAKVEAQRADVRKQRILNISKKASVKHATLRQSEARSAGQRLELEAKLRDQNERVLKWKASRSQILDEAARNFERKLRAAYDRIEKMDSDAKTLADQTLRSGVHRRNLAEESKKRHLSAYLGKGAERIQRRLTRLQVRAELQGQYQSWQMKTLEAMRQRLEAKYLKVSRRRKEMADDRKVAAERREGKIKSILAKSRQDTITRQSEKEGAFKAKHEGRDEKLAEKMHAHHEIFRSHLKRFAVVVRWNKQRVGRADAFIRSKRVTALDRIDARNEASRAMGDRVRKQGQKILIESWKERTALKKQLDRAIATQDVTKISEFSKQITGQP